MRSAAVRAFTDQIAIADTKKPATANWASSFFPERGTRKHGRVGRKAQAFLTTFSYFLRKRSTRPAVSSMRCLPVKKGWQFEQTSTENEPFVDAVFHCCPQAQEMFASVYLG